MEGGGHAVVDGEPGEIGFGEDFEDGADVAFLCAFVEASAVDDDGSGERAFTVGNVDVEEEGFAVGAGVFDVEFVQSEC